MSVFTKEANDQRTIKKAASYAAGLQHTKEEITGLTLADSPEFADTKITSLSADAGLGNTAKSVKSYITQLWIKLTAHTGLTTTAHGGVVASSDSRLTDSRSIAFVSVPATAGSSGTAGSVAYDSNYLYVCTAANTWKRTSLSTW